MPAALRVVSRLLRVFYQSARRHRVMLEVTRTRLNRPQPVVDVSQYLLDAVAVEVVAGGRVWHVVPVKDQGPAPAQTVHLAAVIPGLPFKALHCITPRLDGVPDTSPCSRLAHSSSFDCQVRTGAVML